MIVNWVFALSSTNGLSSDELETKTKSALSVWLQLSSNFQGSVGPVYSKYLVVAVIISTRILIRIIRIVVPYSHLR